jgi:very-short-patch-repair endonuclease
MKRTTVFIGVLKTRADLAILLRDRWYRVPADRAPKRSFRYIAFYQPAPFGKAGGQIRYYADVKSCSSASRLELLPGEPLHPAAGARYIRYALGPPREIARPVRNAGGERVSCGYTTLRGLRSATDIHALFGAPPLERLLRRTLKRSGLDFAPEYGVREGSRCRYRLDFAVFCPRGKLDIECDGRKWHSHSSVRAKDALRDAWLSERGWAVMRLSEEDVVAHRRRTMARIREAVLKLGGGASRGEAP